MSENTNKIFLTFLSMIVPVGTCLGICAITGFSHTGMILGVIIGGLFLIYFLTKLIKMDIKRAKEQTKTQPDQLVVNQNHSLPYQPISLSEDAVFEYPNMWDSISLYIQNEPEALVTVIVDGVDVMQFLNFAHSSADRQTDIAIYFYPKAFSNAHYKRFLANHYIADFEEAADNTFMASYGTDIDKAVKIASYILASVYYVPFQATLEYTYATCS